MTALMQRRFLIFRLKTNLFWHFYAPCYT